MATTPCHSGQVETLHRIKSALPDGWLVTAALACAAAVELAAAAPEQVQGPRPLVGVFVVAGILPLGVRTTRPLTALLLESLIFSVPMLLWGASQLAVPALAAAVAVFACGRYGQMPRSLLAVPVGAGMTVMHAAFDPLTEVADAWVWSLNSIWVFGLGVWFQSKEQLSRALQDQSDERARAAAAEERLTIARDLHDVLAHSLSVMTVQAEAAAALVADQPEKARTAMEAVSDTGRGALREIRSLLPTLRDGAAEDDLSTDLAQALRSLAVRMNQASLHVDVRTDSDVSHLPPEVVACVHHVVREALTNSLRYSAADRAAVDVRTVGGWLEVQVVDPGPAKAPHRGLGGSGLGLRGMSERAAALGGEVSAGPQGAGFRVVARIPAAVAVR